MIDLSTKLKVIKYYEGGKYVGYCSSLRPVPFDHMKDHEEQEQVTEAVKSFFTLLH